MKSSGEEVGRLTFLQMWKQEEFARWEGVFPKMKYGEIWKEVDASAERMQEEFNKLKDEYPDTSDEKVWREVEDQEFGRSTSERIKRFLISEDLKKISEQIDEVLKRNVAKADSLSRTEEILEYIGHNNLKSYVVSVRVLQEMKENTREMKENSHPLRQFAWVAGAGTISGLVVGFVSKPDLKENGFFWTVAVSVVLVLLALLFERSLKSWGRRFVAKLRL